MAPKNLELIMMSFDVMCLFVIYLRTLLLSQVKILLSVTYLCVDTWYISSQAKSAKQIFVLLICLLLNEIDKQHMLIDNEKGIGNDENINGLA
jgi:hypothetical protein